MFILFSVKFTMGKRIRVNYVSNSDVGLGLFMR